MGLMKPTPMDEALSAALKDPKQGSFFYDCFLNADLVVPVRSKDHEEADWRQLGMEDKFSPMFLKFEKGKAVPTFDLLERLQDWAEPKVFDYLLIKGYLLLRILDPSIFIVVNPGVDPNYTLTPEILEKLREAMKPVVPS